MEINTRYIYVGCDPINGDILLFLEGTLIRIFKTANQIKLYLKKLKKNNETTRFVVRMHPCYIREFQAEVYEILMED